MAYDPQRIISHTSGVSGTSSMCIPWSSQFSQVMDTSDIEGEALCMQEALVG